MAASDLFALSALQTLQARGVRVPRDIAVAGFNDSMEGRCATPPLTSVAMPFYEQGEQVIETLLALLEGDEVPERISLPARMVIHQSCGCLDPTVAQAAMPRAPFEKAPFKEAFAMCRTALLHEISQVLETSVTPLISDWVERLLDAFTDEITGESSGDFLSALNEALRQVIAIDGNVLAWQNMISILRQYAFPCFSDDAMVFRAETLWGAGPSYDRRDG